MYYQTYETCKDLISIVKAFWTLEGPYEEKVEKQIIVPDGCMEMIFHYGDLYKQYVGEGLSIIQPRCFVIGQLTKPLEIEPTGSTGIFSVRFHPGGFLPFANKPIKEMENTAVPLETLFGTDGQKFAHEILVAASTIERIKIAEEFLLKKLSSNECIDRVIKSAMETILTANGQQSIEDISKQIKINRRQLERKFALAIGLSPKQLAKTIRLQATLKILLNKKNTSLTSLAYQGEYYDQAHFIRDFKEFTGLTPKEFYGENLRMTSFFIKD